MARLFCERVDADTPATEHVRVEDPDQLEQLGHVAGRVCDHQEVGRAVMIDVSPVRQVGSEQLHHVGGRDEFHGYDLKHPALSRGRLRGSRLAANVEGQLPGALAGNDPIDGPRPDDGGAVDFEHGLENRHQVAAPHLAEGVDVDHSLDPGIEDIIEIQLVGHVAYELKQVALHAVEPDGRDGSCRPGGPGTLGGCRGGGRLRPGRGNHGGDLPALPGLDRDGLLPGFGGRRVLLTCRILLGGGAARGLRLADSPERGPDQLVLRFRFLGLGLRALALLRRGFPGSARLPLLQPRRRGAWRLPERPAE